MKLYQKTQSNIILIWQYIKYVAKQFFKDNCFESASALTYTTLLSLVPFMAVSVFLIKGIPYFQDLWLDAQKYIFSHFVPATGKEVQRYLQEFIKNSGQLTVIGISFLILSSMILIYTIEQTFNRIWGVKSHRGVLGTFLLYWSILTLFPILMGTSFGLSSYLWSLPMWQDTATKLGILNYILLATPFILTWLSFTLIYILIPNCKVDRMHAFFGGLIVAILFEVSKKLFATYVAGINLNALIYGTFATIPFFLLWVYISWMIILLGAELVNAMQHQQFAAKTSSESCFLQAYKWLYILWDAQQQGNSLTSRELFIKEGNLTAARPFAQLDLLEQNNWIKKTESGKYILARDLSRLTLYDFYNSMPWRLPDYKQVSGCQCTLYNSLATQLSKSTSSLKHTLNESLATSFAAIKDLN